MDAVKPRRAAEDSGTTQTKVRLGLAAALVLLAVTIGLLIGRPWARSNSTPTAASPQCSAPAPIAVSQDNLAPLQEVLSVYSNGAPCPAVALTARSDVDVANGAVSGLAGWIPDDVTWAARATGETAKALHPSVVEFAHTPAVFVQEPEVAKALGEDFPKSFNALATAQKTWADYGKPQWGNFRLAMADPANSAISAAAFIAYANEVSGGQLPTGISAELSPAQLTVFLLQNRVAQLTTTGEEVFNALGDQKADSQGYLQVGPRAGIVAEVAALRHGGVQAAYVLGGGVGVRLGLAKFNGVADSAVDSFGAFLASEDGQQALRKAGYRVGTKTPDAAEKLSAIGLDPKQSMPQAPANTVTALTSAARLYAGLAVRTSTVTALDLSGSMNAQFGNGTSRISVVKQFLSAAMTQSAPGTRGALLTFNSDAKNKMIINEVIGLRTNTDPAAQSDFVEYAERIANAQPSGGTPLYNAIQRAYQMALEGYDPRFVNRVLVITDGDNRDAEGSITLEALLAELPKGRDLQKPLSFTFVAIGPDADFATLKKMADHVGGQALWARTADDFANVARAAQFGG